jgi:hypothetical protein
VGEYKLVLYADRLAPSATASAEQTPVNRVIYVAEGQAIIRGAGVAASLSANSAWHGRGPVSIAAGPTGADLLRWELTENGSGPLEGTGIRSVLSRDGTPRIVAGSQYLMRCDRVDFPPGGVAYTHTHQGSGIRCLQRGAIRIDTQGHSFWVEPGGAWFETGADPVFAETCPDGPSHFIRVMILPRAVQGKSSIRYVRPEDEDKPKTQKYQVFVDEPIEL